VLKPIGELYHQGQKFNMLVNMLPYIEDYTKIDSAAIGKNFSVTSYNKERYKGNTLEVSLSCLRRHERALTRGSRWCNLCCSRTTRMAGGSWPTVPPWYELVHDPEFHTHYLTRRAASRNWHSA